MEAEASTVVAVADSAVAAVVVSTAAVAAADTTNRIPSAIENYNNSLLYAGCCFFVACVAVDGARNLKRPQPWKGRSRERLWMLPFPLPNAI